MNHSFSKVVLAYSGGLDTSVAIPWLKEHYQCEVVAMVADVGQGGDLDAVREKALASGASRCYVIDAREEFLREFMLPVVRSGGRYEAKYLLGTAAARPVIARHLVKVAEQEGADAIAHGATGKGNDQVRFEVTVKALNPELGIVAPWREWDIRSREQAQAYAEAKGISVPTAKGDMYSRDENLWHMSHEGNDLEDPWNEHKTGLYKLTTPPEQAPDTPEYLTVDFEAGWPVAVDGEKLPLVPLLEKLNTVAGRHGVGVIDMVENRLVGIKSRGVYETPGGTVLFEALRGLESLVLDRVTMHFKEQVGLRYAELVYDGLWFAPLREALDAFIDSVLSAATGTVRIKLFKGASSIAGLKSPYSLYDAGLATFDEGLPYDHADAAGFINLFALPLTTRAWLNRKAKEAQVR
ncbi:MAG: argininosuccinate synthase [Thermaerobacterales bacterium]